MLKKLERAKIKRELAGGEVAVGIMSDCVAVNGNVLVETVDATGLGGVDKISIITAKADRLKPVV